MFNGAIVLQILGLLVAAIADPRRYDGYKILRVQHINNLKENLLDSLHDDPGVDFWKESTGDVTTDIMVSPEAAAKVEELFKSNNITFTVYNENVQALLDAENEAIQARSSIFSRTKPRPFEDYHSLDEIYSWMDNLASQYSWMASTQSIGKSYEGRDIKMFKISAGRPGKPSIVIEGGIHAREWISPATVAYFIYQLLENYDQNIYVATQLDWYIIPILNPDGYEYSQTQDRMWRKTRSNTNSRGNCVGADPNRNFNFNWGGLGVSSNPCSELYPGTRPFSEPEIAAFGSLLYNNNFTAHLAFHNYGQYILIPWGHTNSVPDDYRELEALGKEAIAALRAVYGTNYQIGTIVNLAGYASGCSVDYSKGVAGIKYTYAFELRDTGDYGFILPPNEILPTAREAWEAVNIIGKFIAARH